MNVRSLRFRLIIWYAGLLIGVFVLFGLAAYQVFRHYLERSLAESQYRRSEQIAVLLLANIARTGPRYVADEIKARYAPENYDRFIRITGAGGRVLYASGRTASFDPTGLPVLNAGQAQHDFTRIVSLRDGTRLLVTTKIFRLSAPSPEVGAAVERRPPGDLASNGAGVEDRPAFGADASARSLRDYPPGVGAAVERRPPGDLPSNGAPGDRTVGAAGEFLIESGGPMQPIDTVLRHFLSSLLLGLPLVALVAVGGGYLLVGRALAPVVRIAKSAEQITLRNLNERLPLSNTGDELEQLSIALNGMILRLSEALEQNRRFLADASHELRTPLAALRGEMESVIEQARSLPEWRDRVGSALEEVDRLAKIVDTLFAISRLDAGEAQQQWARFDLAQLAASTRDQMSLLAEDKGISVACNAEGAVSVEGDRARIKQVVVNLLDNAIKYTPAGGAISLNVGVRDGKAVIEVVDSGIGIPPAALPHIFERFYRVDKARSREVGGAGLGLAIVKSICTAHGGQVNVESSENRGSRFKVELPLAQVSRAKPTL